MVDGPHLPAGAAAASPGTPIAAAAAATSAVAKSSGSACRRSVAAITPTSALRRVGGSGEHAQQRKGLRCVWRCGGALRPRCTAA
jgi:hypothetical protein